ncbi:MAG: SelT/SelW/SelH family protein [Planctomycetes bacterium]|nr:SelT/SelW/SelH family protein [Planctomycetota bacterium]
MSLTRALLTHYGRSVKKMVLVPSDGGKFEVTVNGKPAFSKLAEGRFPTDDEVVKAIDKVMR